MNSIISVNYIFQFINFLIRVSQQGQVLTKDDFNQLLLYVNRKYFDDNFKPKLNMKGGYEVNTLIMDTLDFLLVPLPSVVGPTGALIIPANYVHYSSIDYFYTGYDENNQPIPKGTSIEILPNAAVTSRRFDAIKFPKQTKPIGCFRGSFFQLYPENLQYAVLNYLRMPNTPIWNGTYDLITDTYVYDPNTSVQIEFPEIDKYRFVSYCLSVLGMPLQYEAITAQAEKMKIVEANV